VRRLLPLVDKAHLSHWRDYRGMTALGSAVTSWNSKKDVRDIKLLLEAGADPNVPSDARSDWTPLFHAQTAEHAELLLKYGADPNYLATNKQSGGIWTPMARFISSDEVELVKLGLAYGGRVPDVKMGGTRQLTLLEYAKEVGKACYPLLVETKPGEGSEVQTTKLTSNEPAKDQNVKTNEDFTVEDLLKRGWTHTLIDHLLGREDYRNPVNHFRNYSGKKVFIRRRVELIEASPEFEGAFVASAKRRKMSEAAVDEVRARIAELRAKSALVFACWYQHPDIARLLIEEGADPNLRTNSNFTALHYAAEKGSTELVELLIKAGADVNALNDAQRSPLHIAAYEGNAEIVELLINHGADKEQVSRPGYTPLLEATANRKTGSFAAMRKLLEAGADPNHSATKDYPPLLYAIVISSDRVKLLLDFGADPNISCGSDSNQTPIFHALDTNVAKALLAAGARLDLKDTRGRTPIEHHKYAARDHIAKFLINHQRQAT